MKTKWIDLPWCPGHFAWDLGSLHIRTVSTSDFDGNVIAWSLLIAWGEL